MNKVLKFKYISTTTRKLEGTVNDFIGDLAPEDLLSVQVSKDMAVTEDIGDDAYSVTIIYLATA